MGKFKKLLYVLLKISLYVIAFTLTPLWWLIAFIINWLTPTYKKPGIHIVVGATGSGKSLLKTHIENDFFKMKKKYMTNESSNEFSKEFDMKKVWYDNDTQQNLNGSGVKCITLDEIQLDFDNRDFKDRDYKKIFQPFAKWLTLHRHMKVDRIYFFTQCIENLDVKIRRLAHYIHQVECHKGLDYRHMVNHFRLKMIPKSLRLTSYDSLIDYENGKEYYEMVKKGIFDTKLTVQDLDRAKIRIPYKLLQQHNTFIFEDYFKHKPMFDFKKSTKTKAEKFALLEKARLEEVAAVKKASRTSSKKKK